MPNESIITDSELKYFDGRGNLLKSRTELSIAKMLQFFGMDYEYGFKQKLSDGSDIIVDFKTKKGLIEVIDSQDEVQKLTRISKDGKENIIAIGNSKYASTLSEIGSLFCYDDVTANMASIFVEDPTLNFDYAHILPMVEKCSVLHGHTSSVMVEILGSKKGGMIIDFGVAKKIIKEVLNIIDHKFFINKKYLVEEDDDHYRVEFTGSKGTFDIQVPKNTAYLLNDEATIESLATELVKILSSKMPDNVHALGVYVYEGASKGAHIVSQISR